MIKRIIGTLFAWATLALIVVVALHRGRYTSLVEFRTEEPVTAPSGLPAVPDSIALSVSEVPPAERPDSAGKDAVRTADSLSASSVPLVDSVLESRPAEKPDSAGMAAASGGEL